jgi:hypothetical protein
VTFGEAPNAPVTFTLSELAPDLVTVQPDAESELEVHAAMVATSDPARRTAPRSFVIDRVRTGLLSCDGELVNTVFPSCLWKT